LPIPLPSLLGRGGLEGEAERLPATQEHPVAPGGVDGLGDLDPAGSYSWGKISGVS